VLLICINVHLQIMIQYHLKKCSERIETVSKLNGLEKVIEKVEQAEKLDEGLFVQAISAMKAAFPAEDFSGAELLFKTQPTEAVLYLVNEHLPNWTISLKGKAREVDGQWTCTLREVTARDDDAVIGFGTGLSLSLAILSAVLKASLWRKNAS
jgi:hypothetical protein